MQAIDASTVTAFQLRVQSLEAVLTGGPIASFQNELAGTPHDGEPHADNDDDARTLSRRLVDLNGTLSRAVAVSGHEGLRRFFNRFDSYVQLLYPTPASPFAATLDAKDNGGPDSEEIISANDLIPLETKRELVLAFERDLIEAERLLRDVESLEKRDVAGAGELAVTDTLLPRLSAIRASQQTAQAAFSARRNRLNAILIACDHQADNMSRLFLEAHAQVSELEGRVTRAERAKRKELAETY